MATKVLEFPRYYKPSIPSQDTAFRFQGTNLGANLAHVTRSEAGEQEALAHAIIDIEVLYPASESAKRDIVQAITSLAAAINLLEEARKASAQSDAIVADDCMQHFQMMLPQLFRYRSLGDGYGTIINSIHFALVNRRGMPFSAEQITGMWRVLKELRVRPFSSFEKALDYVAELENVDLRVDPDTLSKLVEDE